MGFVPTVLPHAVTDFFFCYRLKGLPVKKQKLTRLLQTGVAEALNEVANLQKDTPATQALIKAVSERVAHGEDVDFRLRITNGRARLICNEITYAIPSQPHSA